MDEILDGLLAIVGQLCWRARSNGEAEGQSDVSEYKRR